MRTTARVVVRRSARGFAESSRRSRSMCSRCFARSTRPLRGGIDALEDRRDALADTDAHRHERVALLAAAQLERCRPREARSRGAERMSEGDRAAVRVHARLVAPVRAELLEAGDDLARERLVQLDDVHLLHAQARALEG